MKTIIAIITIALLPYASLTQTIKVTTTETTQTGTSSITLADNPNAKITVQNNKLMLTAKEKRGEPLTDVLISYIDDQTIGPFINEVCYMRQPNANFTHIPKDVEECIQDVDKYDEPMTTAINAIKKLKELKQVQLDNNTNLNITGSLSSNTVDLIISIPTDDKTKPNTYTIQFDKKAWQDFIDKSKML
jgi:hypothetical protein